MDWEPCRHLRFFLAKGFTYIGLAAQADAPRILAFLYSPLFNTETKLRESASWPLRSEAWHTCISTLAKALGDPKACSQRVKDEALHIAAKAAFPRITVVLLKNGANPNSRCSIITAAEEGDDAEEGNADEEGYAMGGTTPTQEAAFHPVHYEPNSASAGQTQPVMNNCHWRAHIYIVQVVVFPVQRGRENHFPLVTGCEYGDGDGDGRLVCAHGAVHHLTEEELRTRPQRVYRAYRHLHTVLALTARGGELSAADTAWQSSNDPMQNTHEEACVHRLQAPGAVHGMLPPEQKNW